MFAVLYSSLSLPSSGLPSVDAEQVSDCVGCFGETSLVAYREHHRRVMQNASLLKDANFVIFRHFYRSGIGNLVQVLVDNVQFLPSLNDTFKSYVSSLMLAMLSGRILLQVFSMF